MSDEAARGIDPRFDPRFQRGYVPDVAADRRASTRREPTAPPSTVETELYGPRQVGAVAERPASHREEAAVLEADRATEPDHAAALLAYFAPEAQAEAGHAPRPVPDDEAMFAPRSDARSAPQQARIGPPPSAIGEHADPGMHSERGDARFVVEPEPESESPFVRHPSLRYWVALVASIGFVLTGAVLYWNINLMQMSGMMTLSSEEQALQSAVYSLSSGFMQAGVVGVVLVVGLWAVQTGRGRS